MNNDDLFTAACAHVRSTGHVSNTDLQKTFGIGTGRARKLLGRMEAVGLIGPADALGYREIFNLGGPPKQQGATMNDPTDTPPGGDDFNPTDAQEAAAERERRREETMSKPHNAQAPGSNVVSGAELVAFLERIERVRLEKKGKADLESEIWAEAKSRGYDTTVMKNLLKMRAQSPSARAEQEAVTELYMAAAGMAAAPLFAHVAGGADPVSREMRIASLEQQCPMDGEIMVRGPGGLSIWVKRNKDGVTVQDAPSRNFEPDPDPSVIEDPAVPQDIDLDEDGARELGRTARKDDLPIVRNPYPHDDERRRFWDEGWREQDGGSGFGKR